MRALFMAAGYQFIFLQDITDEVVVTESRNAERIARHWRGLFPFTAGKNRCNIYIVSGFWLPCPMSSETRRHSDISFL